jgi:hypothetical protein
MAKEKNLGKLKSRFEVRGGLVDEFAFHQNQGAMSEEEHHRFMRQEEETALREGEAEDSQPQTEAERIQQMMADAREKAEKNLRKKEKREGKTAAPPARKSSADGKKNGQKAPVAASGKSAKKAGSSQPARAAAKKGATKKAVAQKGAKKSVKRPALKSAGKKVAAKAGSKKSAARKSGGRSR